jgi:hypothetical protein
MQQGFKSFGLRLGLALVLASASVAQGSESDYPVLPKPGGKIPLDSGHYFVYGFSAPPKLGPAIMKVEVFALDGRRDTTFRVNGDLDMPSMRGAHSSGSKTFAVSAKGFYLLPVQIVMPGDWEMKFAFEKDGQTVLRGAYLFDL